MNDGLDYDGAVYVMNDGQVVTTIFNLIIKAYFLKL